MKISIFLPISWFLICWYLMVMALIIIDLALVIFGLCFDSELEFIYYFNFFTLIILLIDIMLSLNIAFIRSGRLIMNRKEILINYIKNVAFLSDIIPLVVSAVETAQITIFTGRYRFILLILFLKLVKIYRFNVLIKRYIIRSSTALLYYQLIKYFIILAFICHIFGSFFYLLDVFLYNNGIYTTDNLWIFSSNGLMNLYSYSAWIKYTYTFYFIVATLSSVAYGDFTPLNQVQVGYVLIMLILPMLIFAYVFSIIYSAIANQRNQRTKIRGLQLQVKRLFQSLKVNSKVTYKVLNFIDYYYQNQIGNKEDISCSLAPSISKLYKKQLAINKLDLSLFSFLPNSISVDVLSRIIKQQIYPISYTLQNIKPILIYVTSGVFMTYMKKGKYKYYEKTLQKHYLNKYQFFTGLTMNKLITQTKTIVICQTVLYNDYRKVISQIHQSYHDIVWLWKDQILLYGKIKLINEKCFFCQSQSHPIFKCYFLRGQTVQNLYRLETFCWRSIYKRSRVKSSKIRQKLKIQTKNQSKSKIDFQTQVQIQNQKIIQQTVAIWKEYYPHRNIVSLK